MHKTPVVKIGTRKSQLAQWQAHHLQKILKEIGINSDLILIESSGDLDQTSLLQNFRNTGIFTRALDNAVLNEEVDLAIHSLKDYPTEPEEGITITSIGGRANPADVLVKKDLNRNVNDNQFVIGTGSIRRRAQWKHKYPSSRFENLRGNVPTRILKLDQEPWDGIILAFAGMERLGLINDMCLELSWMVPAPAQGILGISYLNEKNIIKAIVPKIQNEEVELCARIERMFLNKLEGGCSAPIGALAKVMGDELKFTGCLHDPEGKEAIYVNKVLPLKEAINSVPDWVDEILASGGKKIMHKIKFQ